MRDKKAIKLLRKESKRYRHRCLFRRVIFLLLIISASIYMLDKLSNLGFSIIFALVAVSSFVCGFAMISKGTIFSERTKTMTAVVAIVFVGTGVIYSFFGLKLYFALISIVEYFIYAGMGGEICSQLFRDFDEY